jgi:hypothetical protein
MIIIFFFYLVPIAVEIVTIKFKGIKCLIIISKSDNHSMHSCCLYSDANIGMMMMLMIVCIVDDNSMHTVVDNDSMLS